MLKGIAVEGNFQALDGGSMFGNAPKILWEKWIQPDDKNRISLACRSLLVETAEGIKILFETGIGAFFEPKLAQRYGVSSPNKHLLLENLAAIGIKEEDIDVLVLSHLHFDHCGGLLPVYGQGEELLFPKAEIWLSAAHFEHALQPPSREKTSFIPTILKQLKERKNVYLMDDKTSPLPSISFHYSDGHTVGLMMSEIETAQGLVCFISDLVPGSYWLNTSLSMGFDRFAELLTQEKEVVLEDLYQRGVKLFFTHDPHISFAVLDKNDKGKFVLKENQD